LAEAEIQQIVQVFIKGVESLNLIVRFW